MNPASLIDLLVERKIVTNKMLFVDALKEHKFVVSKQMVEAVGYEGTSVFVPADEAGMFTCCTCSNHCTSEYYGDCDICSSPRCYNCATGNEKHSCTNKDTSSSDEETTDEEEQTSETDSNDEASKNGGEVEKRVC